MRHAARVDENQALIVEALRKAGAVVWIIGLPVDLLIGCNGVTALAEVKILQGKKKPRPARYTDLQRDFMRDWLGGPVATLTDVDGALRLVSMLKGLPRRVGASDDAASAF
jgi:hypothetical protein